jgi:hypothetical protein
LRHRDLGFAAMTVFFADPDIACVHLLVVALCRFIGLYLAKTSYIRKMNE